MWMWASLTAAVLLAAAAAAVAVLLWIQGRRVAAAALAMPAAWGVWVATRLPSLFDVLAARAAAGAAVRYPPAWPLVLGMCAGSVMSVWFVATMLALALSRDGSAEAAWILPAEAPPPAQPGTPSDVQEPTA